MKKILTLLLIAFIAGCTNNNSTINKAGHENQITDLEKTVASQEFPEGITVRSTAVKKIGNEYRYFFHAFNNTNEVYYGRIEVIYDSPLFKDMTLGFDIFRIYANNGGSFYFDGYVAPYYTGIHGGAGVQTLKYKIENRENKVIYSGKMELSSNYSILP